MGMSHFDYMLVDEFDVFASVVTASNDEFCCTC